MPNFLGRVLRYVKDATRYAGGDERKAHGYSSRMFDEYLGAMAQRDAYGQGETMDVDAAMRLAVVSAWAYSDVALIADRIAANTARPQVKQKTDEGTEDIDNHPFERLLARPNALMTGSYLLRYIGWWHQLRGNAYVFISTLAPGKGEPEELWPLPANLIRPLPDSLRKSALTGGLVIDYEYQVAGKLYKLPGENVCHFRTANPFDWWQGLAPLSAAMMGVQLDYNQGKWARDFFGKENAIPTNIISLPADISDEEFELAKQDIREQYGAQRKSAIIRAGDMSVEAVTQTLEQMQINASRELSRKEIDRVFRVPEGLVSGGLSGDSRLAAEIGFARNCVQPLLDYMADEWTAKVGPYYGPDIIIEAPDVVPQERALAIQEMATYGQYRSVNENRGELGLDKVDDPRADTPIVLFTLPQVQEEGSETTPGAPEPEVVAAALAEANEAGTASMAGAPAPEDEIARQAQRSAALEGIRAELDRWRRVALREAKAGRDPAGRVFESELLPPALSLTVGTQLVGAEETHVKNIFAKVLSAESDELLAYAESTKGGPGSGHWGHAGRPGEVGGSLPADMALSVATGRERAERQAAARAKGKGQAPQDKLASLSDQERGYVQNYRTWAETAKPETVYRRWLRDEHALAEGKPLTIRVDNKPIELSRDASELVVEGMHNALPPGTHDYVLDQVRTRVEAAAERQSLPIGRASMARRDELERTERAATDELEHWLGEDWASYIDIGMVPGAREVEEQAWAKWQKAVDTPDFLLLLRAATQIVPDSFLNCCKALEDVYDDAETDLERVLAEVFATFRKRFTKAIADGQPLPWKELEEALAAAIEPRVALIAVDGLLRTSLMTGIAFDPAVVNSAGLRWAREYSFDLIRGINDTTRQAVSEAIQQWNTTPGMVRQQLEDLLAPTFGETRAESIAVTEVTRAAAAGVNEDKKLLAQEGLSFARVWNTRNDERTCVICGPLNGMGEDEPVPGHPDPDIAMKGWGAGERTKDGPPAHPRCRCFHSLKYVGPPPAKGGPGSGNWGHAGRPGEVGGSAPSGTVSQAVAERRKAIEGTSPRLAAHIEKVQGASPANLDAIVDDIVERLNTSKGTDITREELEAAAAKVDLNDVSVTIVTRAKFLEENLDEGGLPSYWHLENKPTYGRRAGYEEQRRAAEEDMGIDGMNPVYGYAHASEQPYGINAVFGDVSVTMPLSAVAEHATFTDNDSFVDRRFVSADDVPQLLRYEIAAERLVFPRAVEEGWRSGWEVATPYVEAQLFTNDAGRFPFPPGARITTTRGIRGYRRLRAAAQRAGIPIRNGRKGEWE